jgi:hypothetical protein
MSAYLVQFFSWIDGSPTTQKVVTLEDMRDWDLYDDDEEMNERYERTLHHMHDKCEAERANRLISQRSGPKPDLRLDDG